MSPTDHETELEYIKRDLERLRKQVEEKYVPIDRYGPIEKLVYTLITLMLTLVISGLFAAVYKL